MIKPITLSLLYLTIACFTFGQKRINKTFYSKELSDSISITIWLPEGWTAQQKFPTFYTFSYGASDAEYIAEHIKYLNKLHISNLPPTIVVEIKSDMDLMGYNYETGLLTGKGQKMIASLRTAIIPLLENKYKSSKFRAYIGQSYGADYGNYLFLHQPDLFSAYMIMSPERIAPLQPPFDISAELKQFYQKRRTYFFMASGGLDLERRQLYAAEIYNKITSIDSTAIIAKYEKINFAGHNNSLAVALPIALDFIYKDYNSFPNMESAHSISNAIKITEQQLSETYGIGMDKNSAGSYLNFLTNTWQNKDSIGMKDAIQYFISDASDARQLRDFAYSCNIVGLKNKAIELYKLAIKKIPLWESKPDFQPAPLITIYRELAFLETDPRKAWATLKKGLSLCLKYKNNINNSYYPEIYFYLGKFAAENNYSVAEGLGYLQIYKEKRPDLINLIHNDEDDLYYYIGKCYSLLHNNKEAKLNLIRALEMNKSHKKATYLLESLN
jgi:hypothetical protein